MTAANWRKVAAAGLVALTAMVLAACGSSGSSSSSTSKGSGNVIGLKLKPGEDPTHQTITGGKKGGSLTVYSSSDFEHLDPGQAYYALDYPVVYATQRPLYSYPPNSETTVNPDLATAMPTVSSDGKTVTVHIHHGVHYSPPVNREATAQDVAFAIERGGNPNVGNAYFTSYFASLAGVTAKYKGGPIPGITTPDKYTIVFHLTQPTASLLIGALSLPVSAPLPPEFVKPLDVHAPTTFGTQFLVGTGPYMLQADKTGKFQGIGYQTGKSATLVRNPNWSAATDYRPAYLDQISVNIGGSATVIGQQVLKGTNAVELDTPDRSIVKLAYEQYPSQITFTPGSGTHYAALDNHHGPFTNVNLRRAVWAALDRNAIVKARGGPLVASPMTHFLYPGVNGYEQSGGAAGPAVDYNANPNGDMTVATKYMKAAGYPSGKYTGNQVLQVVGNNTGVSPAVISIIDQTLTSLGFKTHVTEVGQSVMYAKYCGVPKQEIDVCPTVGWIRDYADPQTVLYPTFWGPGIVPTNNSNWGQVNWQDAPTVHTGPSTTAIDQAMDKAALVVGDAARAQAWANIDKQLVDQAVALPQEFDSQPNIQGSTVVPANQLWNVGEFDFSFTSLK